MATFEEYMATPDPWKKAELVRGDVVIRKPGYAAHGMAISAFMGIWLDYSGERSSLRDAERTRARRQAERRTVGEILPNLGVRYALPDDPDQVRALSIAAFTPDQLARLDPYFAAHPNAFAPEPPALTLDNVLPDDTAAYTQQKVLDLLAAGAQTIWLLYPLIPCVVVWAEGRVARAFGPGESLPEPPGFAGLAVSIDSLFAWRHGTESP